MATRITVLGAGPGGYVAAVRAAQLGAEVTLIEKDRAGGTCLNWGCIPSKVLITSAELLDKMQRAKAFGIQLEGTVAPDMNALMARKQKVVDSQVQGLKKLFAHHRIHFLKGEGSIEGPDQVRVRLADGGDQTVTWDRLILATGTAPTEIPAFPFDGERIISSNEALYLKQIPESIVIVGGGVIGCEFAFLLSALGSRVTVVEALERLLPLPSVDAECATVLQREMKKRKIRFHVNQTVQHVTVADNEVEVILGPSPNSPETAGAGKNRETIRVEKVLVCIGRTPLTRHIGLESIGVKLDERGWIIADHGMVTSTPGVYAIGDVLGPQRIMLAHVASHEAMVAAENAMGANREMDYRVVPGAIFTMPEVANVGLSEAQARAEGWAVRADKVLFRTLGKAHVIGEIAGQAKIVSESGSGKVLGVHLVGPHATDLIAEAALAIQAGCSVADLANTIHAHPTLPEIISETALAALDRPLHG